MNFLKTTLIGGLLFLVPLVVVGVVIGKAVGIMLVIAEPMAAFLPVESAAGVALANLIALACVVLLCFLAGLVGRTALAKAFSDKAESTILQKIPGYTFFKGMTSMLSPDENADLKAVLVSLEKAERLGLEVERVGTDRVAVYFPGSPNAWSGIVQIVSTDQVKPIDIPMMSVIEHAEQLGRGANKILAARPDSQEKQ
jgi:uncharacterized membrane protein